MTFAPGVRRPTKEEGPLRGLLFFRPCRFVGQDRDLILRETGHFDLVITPPSVKKASLL